MAGDGGIIEDLRRRLAGAQQYARRLDGVAVVLDLAGERGKYGADLSGLALEVRGEDHGRDAHLLGDALGCQTGVRQAVEQEVGVLGEGLGRLALGADVHEIVHNGFRQTVGYTVVTDDLPRLFKRRLVGAHRRTFIIFVRLADIAGGRRTYGIRDAEADEFGAAVADALCEHAAVHGGDMASDRVDLINAGAGFEHDIGRVDLILQRDTLDRAAHERGRAAADDDDKQVVGRGAVDQADDLLAGTQSLRVWQRVAADVHFRFMKHVRRLADLDDRNAAREMVAEDLVDRHGHMVAGFAGTEQVDVALLAQIPAAAADAQHIALHVGDALDALVGVELLQGFFRDVQNDLSALGIAVAEQGLTVLDLDLHSFTPYDCAHPHETHSCRMPCCSTVPVTMAIY